MISYPTALALALRHTRPLGAVPGCLKDALGSFLAQDIMAQEPAPAFDQSNMDGFGVRVADVRSASPARPVCLPLIRTIRAGDRAGRELQQGTAVKILTGAPVPKGVQAIVVKEVCTEAAGLVHIRQATTHGGHVRRRGADFRQGAKVLEAGALITPPVIGLLASLGVTSFPVFRKPVVSLLATGNELVAPHQSPGPGQIRDANSLALAAALRGLGISRFFVGHAADDIRALRRQIAKALDRSDVIITVGGVSVGDYDLVKDVVAEMGVRTIFWRVAVKPGMPNYFGIVPDSGRPTRPPLGADSAKQKWLFGLPGNPVSALVSFHQLVKPALLRLSGQPHYRPLLGPAVLTQARHKKAGRLEWIRAALQTDGAAWAVTPTDRQMSHMLSGLATANSLIHFPAPQTEAAVDDVVAVEYLSWTIV
jgi:molybdopterin molybdotransferase